MNNVNNDNFIKQGQPKQAGLINKTDNSPKSKENKTQDIKNGLHKLMKPNSVEKKAGEMIQQGFCLKLWNSFKALFGFGKKEKEIELEPKYYIDEPGPKNLYAPKVVIHKGLVDMNFIEKNLDKYIFILSGNLKGTGGRHGQSSVLRPAKNKYPDSVVEMPVTLEHANVLDPETLKEVSYREGSVEEIAQNVRHINEAIDDAIDRSRKTGKTLLMLKGGYGTGGARMFAFAPKTFKAMNKLFERKLGVRNILDPLHAKYSLDYVSEVEIDPASDKDASLEIGFSPEQISKDLWANGWSLARHSQAA